MRLAVQIRSQFDLQVICLVLILGAMGLAVQFSAGAQDWDLLGRQSARMALAFAVMFAVAFIPLEKLYKSTPYLYLIVFALLVLVLLSGVIGRGAQRWLDLGVIRFQPAELMKIILPMMIGWLLTRSQMFNRRLSYVMAAALVLAPAFLVYRQPDLGTALLVVAVGAFAIFLGGVSWRTLIAGAVVCISAIPLAWPMLHEYQRQRVITLFDPWTDPLGAGYHSIQSMIAIGSGGLSGKGWLQGSQSQLDFIPERSTDFIFSVFAEEFGLIGSVVLVTVYLLLIYRCFAIGYQCNTEFGRIVASCVGVLIFTHLFVNVGMVSGILPVVGVPLPLLSYGGTSMLTVLIGLGLVMGVRNATKSM